MSHVKPRISFIVPVPPDAPPPEAMTCLQAGEPRIGPVEILVTRGRAVSRQRNQAVALARGEILFFMDDDTRLDPAVLVDGLALLEQGPVEVVGGPALTRPEAGLFERAAGLVCASRFGVLHLRARATPVGEEPRAVDGEEFILCNLMMKRETYLRVGGLDEELYPGEDPDLWRRLRQAGARMMYLPKQIVYRGRRRTLAGFALQHFRYGQGRGVRRSLWGFKDKLFLLPTIFVLYLLLLPFLPLPSWPLHFYLALGLGAGLRVALRSGSPASGVLAFTLFPVMHLSYGLGLAAGLFGLGLPQGQAEPSIEVHQRAL